VTTALAAGSRVVSINPIPEQVMRLQIISCDICNVGRASYDVFVDGVINEITVLKRCCDKCAKSFSQS
jgi:hypothetical protein